MDGALLIDKPLAWTSFDAVNYVRKIIAESENKHPNQVKVGHCGTLDPLATGLLILLIGNYTKRASELVKLDKTYYATMKLGETSTTGDAEGEKTVLSDNQPSQSELTSTLKKFTGSILQKPPAFSALKIGGQRAYKLARQGKAVELAARPVTIYKNELISYNYPFVKLLNQVSSGTYIRSLVEDMGRQLETGAYLVALRRTQISSFSIDKALELENLNIESIQNGLIGL
jgi:tRNA pseudouridine55 synthase